MPIHVQHEWYTEEQLDSNPDTYFIFGDNCVRKGRGGQAKVCRDKPNAVGVVTKWTPSHDEEAYFSDNPETLEKILSLIDDDFLKVVDLLDAGKNVVFPAAGIGTGISELPTRAPRVNRYILMWVDRLFRDYSC